MSIIKCLKVFCLCMGLFYLTSCARQNEEYLSLKSDQTLQIKASVGSMARNVNRFWSDGDSLGLYVKPSGTTAFSFLLETNRKYTFSSSNDVFGIEGSQVYYPQSAQIDLIAYSPFKGTNSPIYRVDVIDQGNLKAIDLLYSKSAKNITKQSSPISLSFDHVLSKVKFKLQKPNGSTIGLEFVNIALEGFYSEADFDLATGVMSAQQLSTNPIQVGLAREAILIPNSSIANRVFKFSLGTSTWEFTLPSDNSNDFTAGNQYEYIVTVYNDVIDVKLTDISPWVQHSSTPVEGVTSNSPIEYAYIPSGKFLMGAPDTSTTSITDKPQHWVKISKSFYMSKYEITNAQYAEFLNAISVISNPNNAYIFHDLNGKSTFLFYSLDGNTPYFENNQWKVKLGRENYPMAGVTWHGALAYAQWRGATLPTEAQWEYAYRAGTQTKFFTGNFASDLMSYGNFYNNTGGFIQPVGQKRPNPWGLYDIAGNLLEWCLDGPSNNSISPYELASDEFKPLIDPVGIIGDTGNAYYRGGNYSSPVQTASAYYRNSVNRSYSAWQIGFRIVINP